MMRFFEYSLVAVFVFFCVSLLYVATDPMQLQAQARDRHRQESLSQIAEYFEQLHKQSPPLALPENSMQIGINQTGCQLQTEFCQISSESCIDLNGLTLSDLLTVPADITYGSIQKTHFALKKTGPNEVTITACHSDSGEKLELKKILPIPEVTKPTTKLRP